MRHLERRGLSSQRRACELLSVARSKLNYQPKPRADEAAVVAAIKRLSRKHKRYGYRRIAALLRQSDWHVNIKRVHRIWKQEGLSLPQKRPRKRYKGPKGDVLKRASDANEVWSYDFLEDRTESGNKLRILTIVDEYTRESLGIRVERSISSQVVLSTLEWLFISRGVPQHIRSDNGPEFIAKAVREWLAQKGCGTIFITPGSPWENPYVESFNGRFRDECLNRETFRNGREAQQVIEAWREEYNHYRPHSSLGYLPPVEFARRCGSYGRATPSLHSHSEGQEHQATLSL